MTAIAVTAAQVSRVDPSQDWVINGILAETVTAGQVLYLNSSGTWSLADGSATGTAQVRGMALGGGGAGQAIAIIKKGLVAGFTLSGMAYDARAYLSDTAGGLDTANGTVNVVCGRVHAMSDADKTKVLFFFGADPNLQYT